MLNSEEEASIINTVDSRPQDPVPGGSRPVTDTAYTPGLKLPTKRERGDEIIT